VSFSPDGRELAAGSREGIVRVWDLDTGKERLQFPGGVIAQFSPDGKTLVTVNYAGVVRRWDAATGKPIPSPPPTGGERKTDFLCVHTVSRGQPCPAHLLSVA
jgi:WD40 repeat protein